jgi:4'-phosphopantetheinyl transferase
MSPANAPTMPVDQPILRVPARFGEIQLWAVSLRADEERLTALSRLLTDDELRRADRYRFHDDRRRFIVARGTLRLLLAEHTGQDAGDLAIGTDHFGKPFLRSARRPLHFNLAHSRDQALIAFSRDSTVGIDLEDLDRESRMTDLTESVCSPAERQWIADLPSDLGCRALLRIWSAKEAFLKAMGTGLRIEPSRLEVSRWIAEGSADRGEVRWIDSPGSSSRYILQPLPECEESLGGSAALAALKLRIPHRIAWMGSFRPTPAAA